MGVIALVVASLLDDRDRDLSRFCFCSITNWIGFTLTKDS